MEATRSNTANLTSLATGWAVTVIAIHLVNVAIFHLAASLTERFALSAAVILATSGARFFLLGLKSQRREALALMVGLPTLGAGMAIHVTGLLEQGFGPSHFTGLSMLLAGAVLTLQGLFD